MVTKSSTPGGIKGASKSFYSAGLFAQTSALWLAKKGGYLGFVVVTTSMITLMPLMMEIARESQMIESERSQVSDLKTKGFSDRQLQEMGFSKIAIHSPSVAMK
eukprot:CAMPEP_0118688840 /NCGR_PEP_ID=MMETSP0800-20121206/9143_1 /TAXON_ID=210618 ORGANISM="Striatella unipunctata, Strain CCMP2910" /NCGR_SAMPLE_ID=MMETSP0800 /ASSEMBLY_ACC=CAM_ASM_000638 /LENGTH=103 /DNA_ID=CAMNT_0006586143 /DNA_START=106 /DNA_END=417 /DNA_ORIENTATION=+